MWGFHHGGHGSLGISHPVTSVLRTVVYAGLQVSCPLLPDVNQNWNVSTNVSKIPDIRFYGNPLSRSQFVPCRQTDRHIAANRRIL
jgi:hypothetical protein